MTPLYWFIKESSCTFSDILKYKIKLFITKNKLRALNLRFYIVLISALLKMLFLLINDSLFDYNSNIIKNSKENQTLINYL